MSCRLFRRFHCRLTDEESCYRFFLDNNASTNKHAATERNTRAEPRLPTAMKSLTQ